jgi:hypothetical protein
MAYRFSRRQPRARREPLNNLGPSARMADRHRCRQSARARLHEPERGVCAVSVVTWKDVAPDAPFRVRVSLNPGQMFHLDGADRQSVGLLCGADASTLAAVAPAELILTGATGRN